MIEPLTDQASFALMVSIRRDLHMNPEIGLQEIRTSQIIHKYLRQAGYQTFSCAGTGVVAILKGAEPGPCILLRADIDALNMKQCTGLEFQSKNNLHHACGHDGHTSMLLVAAIQLKRLQSRIKKGCIKFVFQPGQQGLGGADLMLKDQKFKLMEEPEVDSCYAIHLNNKKPVGIVSAKTGVMNANSDRFQIKVIGKSTHTMCPDEGVDANLIGCTIVTALYSSKVRKISPFQPCTLGINLITGGSSYNVVSNQFVMVGAMRTFGENSRTVMMYTVEKTAQGIAEAMDGKVQIKWRPPIYKSVVNSERQTAIVQKQALRLGHTFIQEGFGMAGEDFCCFSQKKPSCMFLLGSAPEESLVDGVGTISHHMSNFTFNEEVMRIGYNMWLGIVMAELG